MTYRVEDIHRTVLDVESTKVTEWFSSVFSEAVDYLRIFYIGIFYLKERSNFLNLFDMVEPYVILYFFYKNYSRTS